MAFARLRLINEASDCAGFVRMGPRRGFHLLLVEECADGFQVVLPR